MIRNCTFNDAKTICKIYNYYIKNTTITFEETALTPGDIEERIKVVTQKYPWLVYENNGKVIGYAYVGEFKSRCAYRFTAESSVYVDHSCQKQGIGFALYTELINRLKQQRIHSIIGVIAIQNDPSIRLHKKLGFEKVGVLKEVGYKFGRWVDVEYWQLISELN